MEYVRIFLLALFFLLVPCPQQTTGQGQPYIIISHGQCRLWLYDQTSNGLRLVREYKAGTAKVGLKKFPLGLGYITDIDSKPIWRPTAYTRRYFAVKKGIYLPAAVPFGHKLNFMGKFRISLSHNVPGKGQIYRIHGVRDGEEHFVGTRVSGCCTRMLNEEGLELISMISKGTPVEFVR